MKIKITSGFFGIVCLFFCIQACSPAYVAVQPANPVVVRPVSPNQTYIWVDGDWIWSGRTRNYTWRNGYWRAPNHHHNYYGGSWKNNRRGHYWVRGRWH